MKVLIYSTTGVSGKEFETNATTWEELQSTLSENQITYDGMKAILGESRLTLESPKAQVPQQDFTLFLMPKKTKSGNEYTNLAYKDCRSTIKGVIDNAKDKDAAKAHFSVNGKNYTQTTTNDMRINLRSWFKKSSSKKGKKEKNVADVESVKTEKVESKVETKDRAIETRIVGTGEDAINAAKGILESSKAEGLFDNFASVEVDAVDKVLEELGSILVLVNARVEKAKREAERLAKEEEERKEKLRIIKEKQAELAKEARELSREFDDVRNL